MRCYREIRRTSFDELTIAEQGVLELERAMLAIRKAANEVRLNWWMTCNDMRYQVGVFDGVRFTVLALLKFGYRNHSEYSEFREIADRYSSEVQFLSYSYLQREVA